MLSRNDMLFIVALSGASNTGGNILALGFFTVALVYAYLTARRA